MEKLHDIRKPIEKDLENFQKYFKSYIKSRIPLLNIITSYVLKAKGKQLRPILLFYSGALWGEINTKSHRAAALIELLHTASLIHDDVVDDADKRRGLFSINALWKNKAAVLVGDYLLSKGLLIALENKDHDMLEVVSGAVRKITEGELLQMEKSRKLDIDEDVYLDIINGKTASLFSACCACGAISVNASEEHVNDMAKFGELLGMAFQIKDDLLDYQKMNKTGKPEGNDIKERKITLPLIYTLNKVSKLEKRKFINIIKNHNRNTEKIKFLVSKVYESGGITYTENKMNDYAVNAIDILKKMPDNAAKESLLKLISFTIDRNN